MDKSGPHPPQPSRRDLPWTFALLSCVLLAALLGTRLLSDFDLGFHLKGGQWMIQNHRFFTQDVYTYTVPGHPYLDIHWLYQILLYLSYRAGGYTLLTALNVALVTLVFLLAFLRLRRTAAPSWFCALLLAACVLTCEPRIEARPELVSWLLFSLTLLVLECRYAGERDMLFLLPLIHLVWANVEGLFPLGWAAMAAYLLTGWMQDNRPDPKLLKYSLFSLAACLFNPNFLAGFLYPFSQLLMLGTSNVFKGAIGELQSPWGPYVFLPAFGLAAYKAYCFLLAALLSVTWRRRKIHEVLLALSFFALSASASRNIPLFFLATLPTAALGWKDLPWESLRRFQRSALARPAVAWAFTFLILLSCVRVATGAYYFSDRRGERFGLGLDAEKQPVGAVRFLMENGLDGPMLNQVNMGGWLDWQAPQKTFIDGRLEVMGPEFYGEYLSSYRGNLCGLADRYGADIILFVPTLSNWQGELASNDGWRLAYLDGFAAVYLRKGYAPGIPALTGESLLSANGIAVSGPDGDESLLRDPRPSPLGAWLEGFWRRPFFPESLYNMASFNLAAGDKTAAEPLFREALRQSRGDLYEIYLNLGRIYYGEGRYAEARLCAQRALEEKPDQPLARSLLANLPSSGAH